MARYMLTWELDPARVPNDIKGRVAQWTTMCAMVDEDMKKGFLKDWGTFPGEMKGFSVVEGSHLEVATMCGKYLPYVRFEVHPLMSLTDMFEMLKNAPV